MGANIDNSSTVHLEVPDPRFGMVINLLISPYFTYDFTCGMVMPAGANQRVDRKYIYREPPCIGQLDLKRLTI